MSTAEAPTRDARTLIPSGQLVTFTLDGVEFGLDIDRVQEIIPRSTITPVPGAPKFVLGVVNLRGMIIPVLDSRLRFHLEPAEPTGRTRIIVLSLAGQATGLQVDSVAEVVHLDDFTLRETPPLVAGVRSDYLAGMVTAGKRLITLINLDRLLDSSEFGERELLKERDANGPGLGSSGVETIHEELSSEELPYVTFALGRESFGVSLDLVEEIIELPPVTKVPDAPPYVMGVICLRDQVLPLLDVIQLLNVEHGDQEARREMVILLSFGTARIGIAVDDIQEIMRVRPDDILPPPQTLSEAEAEKLEGVVIRKDRMVSLLRVLDVISGEDREKLAAMGGGLERTVDIQVETHELPLVVFRLAGESFGLRLEEVREIIMAGLVTPVPRAPAFIEGVLNLRGEVMPVLDLRSRFGLERIERTNQSRIVITRLGGIDTGLVVDAVDEVRNVDQRRLEPPPKVTAVGANAYIAQVARTNTGVIFLLDIQRLLSDTEGRQLEAFQGKKRAEG